MENRINIADLLKDCPKGMELDCTMFENVVFDGVSDDTSYPIDVLSDTMKLNLTKTGGYSNSPDAKCVIFPKGKDTWEGFRRPFKDGDVVATNDGDWIGITTGGKSKVFIPTYCVFKSDGTFKAYLDKKETWQFDKLATEEERQKLFKAIKDNGYKWNTETKTLEKLVIPYFKVGDVVQNVDSYKVKIIGIRMEDKCYEYESVIAKGIGGIPFNEQDEWILAPLKFDINTLEIFKSKVLVRDNKDENWKPAIFGGFKKERNVPYVVVGGIWFKYLIPYEGNEHLLLSKNDCDEFYKTWE